MDGQGSGCGRWVKLHDTGRLETTTILGLSILNLKSLMALPDEVVTVTDNVDHNGLQFYFPLLTLKVQHNNLTCSACNYQGLTDRAECHFLDA